MIQLNLDHIDRLERFFIETPQKIPKITARAINRAAQSARTEAGREVRKTYLVKHGDVIDTIRIKSANEDNLSANVTSKGHVLPLSKFKVTPGRRPGIKGTSPVLVRVKKGAGGRIKSGFVAQMQSGHIGVFIRAGKRSSPINQLYGPSIPQMVGSDQVSRLVEEKAQETLEKRLDHEINRALED